MLRQSEKFKTKFLSFRKNPEQINNNFYLEFLQ